MRCEECETERARRSHTPGASSSPAVSAVPAPPPMGWIGGRAGDGPADGGTSVGASSGEEEAGSCGDVGGGEAGGGRGGVGGGRMQRFMSTAMGEATRHTLAAGITAAAKPAGLSTPSLALGASWSPPYSAASI